MKEETEMQYAIYVNYCSKKGWDMNDLSLDQIMEIRASQKWKDAMIDNLINPLSNQAE